MAGEPVDVFLYATVRKNAERSAILTSKKLRLIRLAVFHTEGISKCYNVIIIIIIIITQVLLATQLSWIDVGLDPSVFRNAANQVTRSFCYIPVESF